MKLFYFSLIAVCITAVSNAQIVNIPDANFKNALVNDIVADFNGDGILDDDVDINDDGEIQITEAEAVLGLTADSRAITSLTGIESFVNLERLSATFNSLTAIDVTSISSLEFLFLDLNAITSIDVSQNSNLKGLDIQENNLSSLDVSNNLLL